MMAMVGVGPPHGYKISPQLRDPSGTAAASWRLCSTVK
jgi:hypothetical protein